MKPKKYPHADISKKSSLFFAIGLVMATSVSLFAINLNVKVSPKKTITFSPVEQTLDEPVEEITFPLPPPSPPIIICSFEGCGLPIPNDTIEKPIEIEDYPFSLVDEVPRFEVDKDLPNDQELLKRRFKENMDKHTRENKRHPQHIEITGRVYVRFRIDTSGYVTVTGVRGSDKLLEAEAQRVIEKLPRLIPAKHNEKIVNTIYHYPILFKLDD